MTHTATYYHVDTKEFRDVTFNSRAKTIAGLKHTAMNNCITDTLFHVGETAFGCCANYQNGKCECGNHVFLKIISIDGNAW